MKTISIFIILSVLVVIFSPVTISIASAEEGFFIVELDVCHADGPSPVVNGDFHWLCPGCTAIPFTGTTTYIDTGLFLSEPELIPFILERPPQA